MKLLWESIDRKQITTTMNVSQQFTGNIFPAGPIKSAITLDPSRFEIQDDSLHNNSKIKGF